MHIIRSFIATFVITLSVTVIGYIVHAQGTEPTSNSVSIPWWKIQSIDTMKISRDLAREKLRDLSFDTTIDMQIKQIAQTGATHVGIATPYDDQFIPILNRWVQSARNHNLKVWFRGNFSGWEKWFGYPAISRAQHLAQTADFIKANGNLFEEGDIFTPCPECENGGPGDPRLNGDSDGHKQFLIDSYRVATEAFRSIGKGIEVGYYSMNYDVAKLIMDPKTTTALGGIVTIDHYVRTPERLDADISAIARSSGGRVYLGEFGAPIPDIHGNLSELDQQNWIDQALRLIAENPHVVGVNYWVNVGGSTALWKNDGTEKKAVKALTTAYTPLRVTGKLVNQLNKPITNVEITSRYQKVKTDRSGQFTIPYLSDETELHITGGDYADRTINIPDLAQQNKIIIEKRHLSILEKILAYMLALFSKPQ